MIRRSPRNNPAVPESQLIPLGEENNSSTPLSSQSQQATANNNNQINEQLARNDEASLSKQAQRTSSSANGLPGSSSTGARSVSNQIPMGYPPTQPNIVLSDAQFRQLLGGVSNRQDTKATFSNCTARFSGGRNSTKVEDFLATILVYKDAENISDFLALTSLPLLLEGYASTWWQGVQNEARTFNDAVDLLKKSFAPIKPDWRIFNELCQEKQKSFESTDMFVCRKRRLFAQLSEKVSEKTMLDMLFGQLSLQIRGKVSRDSVRTFQDLLQQAREIEMTISENRQDTKESKPKHSENVEKPCLRCTYCRKKNHLAENCFKKIEAEKHKHVKVSETKINCYGCGAEGYYRSNCPNCNKDSNNVKEQALDFNSLHTPLVGSDVPLVDVNINGLNGEAYLDTAARTSVAGFLLYQKLIQKGIPFQKVNAEIVLADGIARNEVVYSTLVDIIIGKRFKKIRFICLPNAIGNRTLLGVDFLKECGMVLDLAQHTWYFKDDPKQIFSFKSHSSVLKTSISMVEKIQEKPEELDAFLSWFENKNNEYSPGGINKIFESSIPDDIETPKNSELFPPLKKTRYESYCDEIFTSLELNSFDIKLRSNEGLHLKESQKVVLNKLLLDECNIFDDIQIPISKVEHHIKTENHEPISNPPYRLSPKMKILLKQELEKMLESGIIEETESPWSFPVVLIPKKDGTVRLCVDYRRLNAITTTDTYPLPRIDDLLHAAKTTPFMSTLDLRSGYWQIKVAEKDRLKTAFTTPFGIYVFNRMPFGLKNAPATFQRLIDKFKASLPDILILAYLDDIIICSKDFQSHISELKQTFQRLKNFGFRLHREKCFFCKSEVKYLGHILTRHGLEVDKEKTDAINNRPNPKTAKEVLSFMQTCSWYRRFIPSFANIAKPLSDLTKKNAKWNWGEKQQEAFNTLKRMLTSPPILQQVNEELPFVLKTDASNYALGAVLLQGEKESERTIEYASRLLLPAERNYSTTEREALAVVWAVQKFRGYIEGSEVLILTDHQPLKWLFSLKSPTGRLARWALLLQTFNIKLAYTPARQNCVADTLSRPPCHHSEVKCECLSIHIDFPRKGAEEFRKLQLEDPDLQPIIKSFEDNDENTLRYTDRGYIMLDGVLYRYCAEEDSENGQLVVPKSMRKEVLYNYHDVPTAGHYGIERTINRITQLYYWPKMRKDISEYVKDCIECKRYKPSNMKPAGLVQTVNSKKRFETIAIDLFGPLPRTSKGNQWIFIIEDLCSRWTELFSLKEASAEKCALILLNEVLLRYGIPRRIHSDNGPQFVSAVMQKLCYCLGIRQTFTPVYHPEANPVERKNRDLKVQLSICVKRAHTTWDLNLASIRFAMNSSKCATTGYSAAYLTFGRELRTPFEVQNDLRAIVRAENFVPQITPHLVRLADSLTLAREAEEQMQDKNKLYADMKRCPQKEINVGDKVLVATHILSKKSSNITSKFVPRRDGPFIVIAKHGSSCYTIASVDTPDKPIGTFHTSDITLYGGHDDNPIYERTHGARQKVPKRATDNKEITTDHVHATNNEETTDHSHETNKETTKGYSYATRQQHTQRRSLRQRKQILKNA